MTTTQTTNTEGTMGTITEVDYAHRTHFDRWVLLHAKYPCCETRATFRALTLIPREVYTRRCGHCGQKWEIERRTVKEEVGKRVDVLEWEEVAARGPNKIIVPRVRVPSMFRAR